MTRAALVGVGVIGALVLGASAARADEPLLEIDDCKQTDLRKDEIEKQGYEHYDRGENLYAQGDYEGTVRELVYTYCLQPSLAFLLKDIGQAYERALDYERAVAYFERYVRAVPDTAKPAELQDRVNVERRLEVLKKLRAKIQVESQPPGARITISNASGGGALARAGETLEVVAGRYEMTAELDGYVTHHQTIDVKIGKPYTYFVPLVAKKGRLALQVLPPDARIFLGDRLVGIGHIDVELEGNTYAVTVEAPSRVTDKRQIEVLANQVKHVQVELALQPQFGRRQLIGYTTGVAAAATAGLLNATQTSAVATFGALAGGAAGFVGSVFWLPDNVALGTSNLAITASLAGGVLAAGTTLLFTPRESVFEPVTGAGLVVAGAAGYLIGDATHLTTGDAALINSAILWGSVTGSLFAVSFDPGRVVGGGLVLSGLAAGTLSGVLLQRNFTISRTHAALIDVGGLVGVIGGLAFESLAYPRTMQATTVDPRSNEHLANFALGGMALGLLGAGILTRNIDDPKIPVTPTISAAVLHDGSTTPVYGFTARW